MTIWDFEPGHSSAEFAVRHMMVTWVRGWFKNLRGALAWEPERPGEGTIEVEIPAGSFTTEEPERDAHLRSADFLDVEHFPTLRYISRAIEVTGHRQLYVHGEFTLRGATRPVTLEIAECLGPVLTPFQNTRIGFLAHARLNREEFGLNWDSPMPGGGRVVGKYIYVTLDIEAIRRDGGKPASFQPPA